jgi:hypothetical protein
MIRVLIVMLGLLLAGHSVEAAPWTLPAGIKTHLKSMAIPWLFSRAGRVSPSYSCMAREPTIDLGHDRWNHRRVAFGSLQ